MKLTAAADVFENKLNASVGNLSRRFASQVNLPEDKKFIGVDAYKHAMDALRPGDVAILATPPAFRWVQFQYAIEKGLHVFMEKPICVDAPTGVRMIELGEQAKKKNLKVGVGLMVRHCRGRQALYDQLRNGAIGDIVTLRAYRMHPPVGSAFTTPKIREDLLAAGNSELLFQIARFHSFLWLSGGLFNDFYIHQIDECCWMKDAWPVKCHAVGGRHYREDKIDQNFDVYQVEYTFADGTKFFMYGRTMGGVKDEFSSIAHGSKGMATISLGGHHLGKAGRIYKGHLIRPADETWSAFSGDAKAPDPYNMEWADLIEAIQKDLPYNEVKRGAEASMVSSMGRFAAHTGQEVTWDDYLQNKHEFAPGLDKLTDKSPAPLRSDKDGKYPLPMPGLLRDREYREFESA
jgi:predicted dehydrogenase